MIIPDECPRYRVRLFLSADLGNSTSFKSSHPPHLWAAVFRDFYDSFAQIFKRNHLEIVSERGGEFSSLKDRPPLLWKTVGDEVIFVNTVDSCFEVFVLILAFSRALSEYGEELRTDQERNGLSIKGNGWIASFPYPNISILVPGSNGGKGNDLQATEALERKADSNPSQHEFLGTGIDYGFRIGSHSSEDFVSISPALADILARARVNEDYHDLAVELTVKPPMKLKGVMDGRDYPVIGIPIDRSAKWASFRKLQGKLLGSDQSNNQELRKYFRHFIEIHDIEEPILKIRSHDEALEPPAYYFKEYVPIWKAAAREVEDQDTMMEEQENAPTADVEDPKPEDVTEIIDSLWSRFNSSRDRAAGQNNEK